MTLDTVWYCIFFFWFSIYSFMIFLDVFILLKALLLPSFSWSSASFWTRYDQTHKEVDRRASKSSGRTWLLPCRTEELNFAMLFGTFDKGCLCDFGTFLIQVACTPGSDHIRSGHPPKDQKTISTIQSYSVFSNLCLSTWELLWGK